MHHACALFGAHLLQHLFGEGYVHVDHLQLVHQPHLVEVDAGEQEPHFLAALAYVQFGNPFAGFRDLDTRRQRAAGVDHLGGLDGEHVAPMRGLLPSVVDGLRT